MPKIAIFPLIIQALVAYSIIPVMGIVGASIAFLISSISVGIIQTIVFLKLSNSTFQDILLKREDFYTVKDFIGMQFGKIMSLLFHKKKIKNIL